MQMSDTPVGLCDIKPDDDDLLYFFPALYPFRQEPRDAKEYVNIMEKIKSWSVMFKQNYEMMTQMFESTSDIQKGSVSRKQFIDILHNVHAIFDEWNLLQKKLVGRCNELS